MIPGLYEIFNTRWGGQTVWVSSDWHFGDSDLRIGHPDRISDDGLVKLLNSKAGRKDTLICLGDVGEISYVRKLRAGYKVLIKGNHDAGSENYKRKIVKKKFSMDYYQKDEALMEMKRLYPDCKYSIDSGFDFHTPFEYWEVSADNGLFDEVYDGALLIGEKLMLSHEPIKQDWALDLHGHDHNHKLHRSDAQRPQNHRVRLNRRGHLARNRREYNRNEVRQCDHQADRHEHPNQYALMPNRP